MTNKHIQLPKELSHWFNRQVCAMRDLNNAVLVVSEDSYKHMETKIRTRTRAEMSDKPRMSEFLLSGIVSSNITKKGTLHLPENLMRYIGDDTHKFKETPRGTEISSS